MSLFKSVATFGGFTLISRLTGFLRDVVLANFLGAGAVSDAFFVAFKLPNLFRNLFAEGAFSAAFVPMISQNRCFLLRRQFPFWPLLCCCLLF